MTDENNQGAEGAWLDSVDESIREAISAKNFKTPGDLAKSYVELEKGFSSRVPLPKDENDTETANKLYSKLGRPDSAGGYQLSFDSEKVQALGVDVDGFRETAFGSNMTQKQAQAALSKYIADADKVAEKAKGSIQKPEYTEDKFKEEMRGKWGDKFDEKYAAFLRATAEFSGDAFLNENKFNPAIADSMVKIGSSMKEDSGRTGAGGSVPGTGKSKQDLLAEANGLMKDEKGPYWDKSHAEHQATFQRVRDLFKAAENAPA